MSLLPKEFIPLIVTFASLFSKRVCSSAIVLLVGAILAPGKRTVSAILRVMGLEQSTHFQRYHRVLNRAVWSALCASKLLMRHLIDVFVEDGVLVMGIDETIERRRGNRIAAKGIYRDPVRSRDSQFVKCSVGWALPFLSVLAPCERYHQLRHQRHKKLTDWARRMLTRVRRWVVGTQDRPGG